ncbi:MAG: Helicase associated domain protein [Candidatus Scalindua sp.]
MLPKHHKTNVYLNAGLFDNISSFAELEKRISGLPTPVEEGDAFEVFAEAYFFTQKIEQAEEVWPFKYIPSRIKEDLSLGTNQKDMGVDGVYKTTTGKFNAYQAKFRTGRKSLTWSEISTFMGLTDKANQRVLFTNSNDITSVINERSGFHCIRGNDLDRLEKKDFKNILKWLKSGILEVERKTPQPHQTEAINDILNALEAEVRTTSLMACGTGKTLVALWVSEQMDCQNILVLLPSLTLVRQTLHEWLKETGWSRLSYLCVCSDPTVASKELDIIKVNQFDLGIFDEAHKTAGRKGKKFSFALKDDKLRIKKRLFLTATPRHYNINKKNEEGDFDLVYSMDNPDVYGEIAHTLSFAKAARQDIICNYKVIISVVTSEQINKEMLKRGEVLINGDVVNAQHIANQIAFKEAINKYGIRRIFTFHKSVNIAKSFTGKGSEGIQTQLPEFNTFHVNGTMTTAVREGIMHEFKNSEFSVISNARCLTEGVNLPVVDMVAFMSPKKSKIDIIQATGRAMRKDPSNPDKALGYILVPLYLEITTGESIEDAVDKADFKEVWNVLQVLQEQDEVLADIIRQMQEDKGKSGEQEGNGFSEIIDIYGVDISLKTLQESITAVCVDKLGCAWDIRYGELKKYKEQFGDCNVPRNWTDNKQLGTWVGTQRANYHSKILSDDRTKRLEDIGFAWAHPWQEIAEKRWEEMFGALKEYMKIHGDSSFPRWTDKNIVLARWANTQRENYHFKRLGDDQIRCLENIGFSWDLNLSYWVKMFNAIKNYKEEYGNCSIPANWTDQILVRWVHEQREDYRHKKLNDDQIKRLEDIGFIWDHIWENMFNTLYEYKKNHGSCNVPYDWIEDNKPLGQWARAQHRHLRSQSLVTSQIKRLKEIGF